MLNNLRYISAQPANTYFIWQVDVMLTNFAMMGVDMDRVDVLCGIDNNHIPYEWLDLADSHEANFYFYNDTRASKGYIPSIRPNLIKQHFLAHPNVKDDVLFYHDCDIIFTNPPSKWITEKMLTDQNWYGSDVNSYIGYDYIKSKGKDVFDLMTQIVGIDQQCVIDNSKNCIGAQYIIKGTDYQFWHNVEVISETLYERVSELNAKLKIQDPTYYELQIWCSCMWTVLWTAWMRGVNTIADPILGFSWGTSMIDEYDEYNIMHNAGVVGTEDGLFHKGSYTHKYPYGLNLQLRNNMASKKYYEWVQEAEKRTVLKYL